MSLQPSPITTKYLRCLPNLLVVSPILVGSQTSAIIQLSQSYERCTDLSCGLYFCSAFWSLPGHIVHRMQCLHKPFESNGLATRTIFRKMGEACLKIHRQSETSNSGLPCSGYLLVLFSCQLCKRCSHALLPQL